ncbi:MAG TPA: CRISPR system precrRNA processing endoribonuclease RAMP protein Cas6 [Syntrophorhabdaceae bacterium]|nr:CRISPR system precrRNA processing endoribonuclease RAMP protein Cas6 [Syntrophorhabdaceae bacterium]HPU30373.1 CRISPR system precrRNA processing endoribonuclease RAMP protein Cas6 [Syntrophorhabdaceae bacterium]
MKILYKKFLLEAEAIDPIIMPAYKGSTLRGGFGNVFKRITCPFRNKECNGCMLKPGCIYAYVYETHPMDDAGIMNMNKYEKIPHPFVIEPPEEKTSTYRPGERITFNLILIGRAIDFIPYFIYTFDELGKIGIGRGRGKYRLKTVIDNNKEIYSAKENAIKPSNPDILDIPEKNEFLPQESKNHNRLKLTINTPVRILYNRRLTSYLEFHILMRNLLRRIGLLYYFHCEKNPPAWDHKIIIKEAEDVKIHKNNLRWFDWERYSTRQHAKMKMGGLIGDIVYEGNIKPFMPYLKAGEIFHIGKGTSFGLGKYVIENLNIESLEN